MANSKFDFNTITSSIPEVIMNWSDMVKEAAFMSSDFSQFVTIVEDIAYGKKVGFVGKMTDFGKKATGAKCSLNEVAVTIPTSEKSWTPENWDSRLFYCVDDLAGTIMQRLLNKGISKYDMTDTVVFEEIRLFIEESFSDMNWRFSWFADKDAANYDDSPAGFIKNGVDITLFNMNDGLFKKLETIVGLNPAQQVQIAANAQASYATQQSTLTPALALEYANDLYYKAPLAFRQSIKKNGAVAMCTLSIHDKLKQAFQGKDLESMLVNLENGKESIRINGIDFVAIPEWDYMIQRYFDNGTKWHNPHRMVLAAKGNLLFGIPSLDQWGQFEAWYEKKDKGVYIDVADSFDTQIPQSIEVMYAV